MSSILVVGNGESRKDVDLDALPFDSIIGCNAIFREYKIPHLVCCDRRMAEEAILHSNADNSQIYVRDSWYKYFRKIKKNKRIHIVPELPYSGDKRPDDPFHWGSGPYAILLSTLFETDNIYIMGFDLYGNSGKVNNIYKDTKSYADSDSRSVDPSYWIYQIGKIFSLHKDKKFVIINENSWKLPDEWNKKNVDFMSYKIFHEHTGMLNKSSVD